MMVNIKVKRNSMQTGPTLRQVSKIDKKQNLIKIDSMRGSESMQGKKISSNKLN